MLMETADYSAISATTYQTTRSHIHECSNSGVKLMLMQTYSPAKGDNLSSPSAL
jgi:hypothetical protein